MILSRAYARVKYIYFLSISLSLCVCSVEVGSIARRQRKQRGKETRGGTRSVHIMSVLYGSVRGFYLREYKHTPEQRKDQTAQAQLVTQIVKGTSRTVSICGSFGAQNLASFWKKFLPPFVAIGVSKNKFSD